MTSVGSRGDSYDNAPAESLHSLYKAELIRKDGPGGVSTTSSTRPSATSTGSTRSGSTARLGCSPAELEASYYTRSTPAIAVGPQ